MTKPGKSLQVSSSPGCESIKSRTSLGGVKGVIGISLDALTQFNCIAVCASLLPQSIAPFSLSGSGKLHRSHEDSSGTEAPKPGTRFEASTTLSQYSSVITGGVIP